MSSVMLHLFLENCVRTYLHTYYFLDKKKIQNKRNRKERRSDKFVRNTLFRNLNVVSNKIPLKDKVKVDLWDQLHSNKYYVLMYGSSTVRYFKTQCSNSNKSLLYRYYRY